jgi:exopolysaccharide biosynthesis WecB/TagA/CpsF family protein
MIDRGRHNVLGVLINAVDYEAAVSRVVDAARKRQPLGVTALAVHGVMTGVMDNAHRHRLNNLDLVLPDGQPVRWALNYLYGTKLDDRVYGPRLMLETCARAEQDGLSIFLLGADQSLLDELKGALLNRFPKLTIAGTRPSLFRQMTREEKRILIQDVRDSGAQITFVGLGCPRQEVFVYEFCDELTMPCLAVGAAFSFLAGSVSQAPVWMQNLGLEWLYRLSKEPSRLWKRYLLLNPLYAALLMLQMGRLRCPDASNTTEPAGEILYG